MTVPRTGAVGQLVWTSADGAQHSHTIGVSTTIGREEGNDIVLEGDRVASRRHARIDASGGVITLVDLGSVNGTLVNGQRVVAPLELRAGDQIAIGKSTFTFGLAVPPPRLVVAPTTSDSTTMAPLPRPAAGWLALPNGERRILGAETRIGRHPKNDITLDDSQVSRNHAHIRRLEDRFVLSDLGSANGVYVNGEVVVTPRPLANGDVIGIGDTKLTFSLVPFADSGESPTGSGSVSPSETNLFSLAGSLSSFTGMVAAPTAMKGDLRTVTVLFTDMHGFTAMSERLNNAELTTAVMNQVFEALTAEIVRYDGYIDKYAGDNIMALFGAPRAHEDDPERAIKAALAMQRALENFNRRLRRELGLSLQMRTGINTGEVLFGQVGGGQFRSNTVMGDTVNLASRLEHAARVGHILIGESTYNLAKHAFQVTPLPPMDIKGVRDPVQAYEVVREKRPDEVLREPAGADTLVGREDELQQLRSSLYNVLEGNGRLVSVIGDVGIGTSQLLAAFRRAESDSGVTWIVNRCLSYNNSAPYSLLAGFLRSLLNLDAEETLDRAKLLTTLKETLGQIGESAQAEYLALLGQILGVQINNAFIAGLEAKVRRKLTTSMIRALVAARARREPLIILFEEMQWVDLASIDALDELVEALPQLPVLLLFAYRPEWSHGWSGRSFYRQINLPELNQEQSRRLLRQILRAAELPDTVADTIVRHCGGNPLLLQETTKALQDRGVLVQRKGVWALTADVSMLNIPSTLRGVMMARIDRLSEQDRAVLQKAAVIGRSFTYRLLASISGLDDAVDESIAALKDHEIISELPLAAEPEYHFKHTITQELAYNNMLATERRALHERIGDALEKLAADRPDEQLEVLAYHYSRSGNKVKAIEYMIRSGEKARRLYANATAIALFSEALDKFQSLPAKQQQPEQAVRLRELLGDVRLLTADLIAAQQDYEAGLGTAAGAGLDTARLWHKLGLVWERRGDYQKALGSYERGISAISPGGERDVLPTLQAAAARAHAQRGDYPAAIEHANNALQCVERRYGPHEKRTRAEALHVLGLVAYATGQPDEALAYHLQSLELFKELGDTMGMQESYNELGSIYWSRGQLDQAFEHLVSLTQVLRLNMRGYESQTANLRPEGVEPPDDRAIADAPVESVVTSTGDTYEAPATAGNAAPIERYYRSGLSAAQQVGDLWGVAVSCNRLGGMLFRQGAHERALFYLHKAVTEAERIGAREVAAQASVNLGAIMVERGDLSGGLTYLERGLTYAEVVQSAITLAEGNIRLAEGKLAAGDPESACEKATEGHQIAARLRHRAMLGLAERVLGQIAACRADWADADQHFRAAIELQNEIQAQQEIGRTYYHYAEMWRAWARAGNTAIPEGATVMLHQAVEIFARLDMEHDLTVAEAALAA